MEKLKITPRERKAVFTLLVLFVILSGMEQLVKSVPRYDNSYYLAIDKEFERRSRTFQEEKNRLLARYRLPESLNEADRDTLVDDSTASEMNERAKNPVININVADAGTLQSLPGIGSVYAERIIKYRNENGRFENIEELLNVKGIGKKRLEKLKPFVKLK